MLAGCSNKELALIARLAEQFPVAAGEVLTEEGARGSEFYVLLSGHAAVTRRGELRAEFGPGAHFGELAVLDPQPRTATVRMTSPGEVLEIRQREFYRLLEDSPALSRQLLIALAGRLHEVEDQELPCSA